TIWRQPSTGAWSRVRGRSTWSDSCDCSRGVGLPRRSASRSAPRGSPRNRRRPSRDVPVTRYARSWRPRDESTIAALRAAAGQRPESGRRHDRLASGLARTIRGRDVILRRALVVSVLVAFPLAAPAQLVPCEDQGDVDTVASALSAIERSVETKRPVRRIGR